MRHASRQRTALVRTTSSTPSAQSSVSQPSAGAPLTGGTLNGNTISGGTTTPRTFSSPAPAPADRAPTEVILTADGALIKNDGSAAAEGGERQRNLAIAIRQRIESRLVGRIRELAVRITGNTVVLEGKCCTYYSKQLAQHAALGALEDEHLENAIVVEVPR